MLAEDVATLLAVLPRNVPFQVYDVAVKTGLSNAQVVAALNHLKGPRNEGIARVVVERYPVVNSSKGSSEMHWILR